VALIYDILEFLIPFDFIDYNFMKNALIGVLLVTPMFGSIGTMVVNNKMAFFSDALGHSALTGIALGVILKVSNVKLSMIVFSIILSIAIVKVKESNTSSTDTIIGVFSSTAVALGIVILSYKGGFNKYSNYLIGDLLSITTDDLKVLLIVFIAVLLIWNIIFNKLLIVGINQCFARSKGINTRFYEYIFTMAVAVIVTVSIQWVGVLIISSMLVLPAAASRNIARNIKEYVVFSVLIALTSGIVGLILSYYLGSASGATIVLVSSIFFLVTFLLKKVVRG